MKTTLMHIIASRTAVLALMAAILLSLTACHTTEENYRASYNKAVEKTKEGIGSDTYEKIVAEQNRKTTVVNGDSVRIVARFAKGIDIDQSKTKRFNVVLRDFKQVVNARSMCKRLVAEGHNSYVLYYAKDQLYYVIIEAFDTREEAAAFLHDAPSRVKMSVALDKLWILEKLN